MEEDVEQHQAEMHRLREADESTLMRVEGWRGEGLRARDDFRRGAAAHDSSLTTLRVRLFACDASRRLEEQRRELAMLVEESTRVQVTCPLLPTMVQNVLSLRARSHDLASYISTDRYLSMRRELSHMTQPPTHILCAVWYWHGVYCYAIIVWGAYIATLSFYGGGVYCYANFLWGAYTATLSFYEGGSSLPHPSTRYLPPEYSSEHCPVRVCCYDICGQARGTEIAYGDIGSRY
eukprot:1585445-Rhodomonas_salina.1